jgi:hypothetical protein
MPAAFGMPGNTFLEASCAECGVGSAALDLRQRSGGDKQDCCDAYRRRLIRPRDRIRYAAQLALRLNSIRLTRMATALPPTKRAGIAYTA